MSDGIEAFQEELLSKNQVSSLETDEVQAVSRRQGTHSKFSWCPENPMEEPGLQSIIFKSQMGLSDFTSTSIFSD